MTRGLLAFALLATLLAGCGNQTSGRAADLPAPSPPREGWRHESWHDVRFQVPEDWEHGAPSQWCIDGGTKVPKVLLPDTAHTQALCTHPHMTYGVWLLPVAELTEDVGDPERTAAQAMGKYGDGIPGRAYPEAAVVRVVETSEWGVVIVAPDATTADGIAASVTVGDHDARGCPAEDAVPATRPEEAVLPQLDRADAVLLCHYAGEGGLRGSELLEGRGAAEAIAALQATEVDPGTQGDCDAKPPEINGIPLPLEPWIVVHVGDRWVWAALQPHGCLGVGIMDGPDSRRFTRDALHWLMTPGVGFSFSPGKGMPMPGPGREA